MPRPLTNNPSNLPKDPVYGSDREVNERNLAEFRRRIAFILRNYRWSKTHDIDTEEFRQSRVRLRRALKRKRKVKYLKHRLHPVLESLINIKAQQLADNSKQEVTNDLILAAAKHVDEALGSMRGRPGHSLLKYHIAGLVAVIQIFSGKPILPQRSKNSEYDPHFEDGVGKVLEIYATAVEPSLTTTQLVNLVREIRREYAGRHLHFEDLFPTYFITDQSREEPSNPKSELRGFIPNSPIYCP